MTFDASEEDVLEFIKRVEEAKVLGRSSRRLLLLEHLLRSEINGNGKDLKAYSIGLDIFQKGADFDPSADSIVRVEMGRLRTALTAFEGTSYADTSIQVTIPKGTYRPEIKLRNAAEEQAGAQEKSRHFSSLVVAASAALVFGMVALAATQFWSKPSPEEITVAVLDFDGPRDAASLVKSTILSGLSRSSTIDAISIDATGGEIESKFVVSGTATQTNNGLLVVTELSDGQTNKVEWVKTLSADDPSELPGLVEEEVSRELRVHLYGAFKRVLEQRDIESLSAEELFVLATWVPGPATNAADWEEERIRLAELAIDKDEEFGKAHSVLADKIAYLANMHAPANTSDVSEQAAFHAERALELEPLDPDVVFNAAQGLWHLGRIAESERVMKRVVQLDPSHDLARFISGVIPYTCAAAPDSVVEAAVAFDQALSSDNPIRWLTLAWIGRLHAYRGEWEAALDAQKASALVFEIPYTAMRYAMVLNKLGRLDDAKRVIDRQRRNWPNIDPTHFAEVTIPRLCHESPDRDRYIQLYSDLAKSVNH